MAASIAPAEAPLTSPSTLPPRMKWKVGMARMPAALAMLLHSSTSTLRKRAVEYCRKSE